ncbi:MAG: DUF4350 domain-containing protein [Sphingobacteriales bacterium]|nr:MAG: DUF4350 domain-containing protein [Sphingobacteriales bacterium]
MQHLLKATIISACLFQPLIASSQQEVDNGFIPVIEKPLFPQGKGPLILVDAAHFNFHTLEDKFAPFGKIATGDGFRTASLTGKPDPGRLGEARILVIANALHEKNTESWQQPVHQAFSDEEIKTIRDWVWNGGRLFLIADHMPFAGAVSGLAQELGYRFHDGFALKGPNRKFDLFSTGNGMLRPAELLSLHGPLDSIVSFTGQAFEIPDSAVSVMQFDSTYKVLLPEVAWEFSRETKMIPAGGLSQLAYGKFGKGRVVVAGEAAMFTAQRVGDMKFGLNNPMARHNVTLLRNILEWLNG